MKRANGSGSIVKLSGNRRKPYMVRISAAYDIDENGKLTEKRKILGYYSTKKEASEALNRYNSVPFDIDGSMLTFKELYEEWSSQHFRTVSDSRIAVISNSYKKCSELYERRFADLRVRDFQKCIDDSGLPYPSLFKLRELFVMLSEYAMRNDYILKNYAVYASIAAYKDRQPNKLTRYIFTDDEISKLWKLSETNRNAAVILMLIYTGLRIGEMLDLKVCNVDLQQNALSVIKSKTSAGVRTVPIADKVVHLFSGMISEAEKKGSEYVVQHYGKKYSYQGFRHCFDDIVNQLHTKHTFHDTRHTTTSKLLEAGVELYIVDMIIGHVNKSLTINTYTHLQLETLRTAINKI